MSDITCSKCGKTQKTFIGNYKYLESGLDNVIVCNVEMIKCECGVESALIHGILSLHEAIANCLLEKETMLTGREIKFLRKEMGLRGKVFANVVGIDNATLSRWENDKSKPSARADRLIRFLYATQKIPEKAERIASFTYKPSSPRQPQIPMHVMANRMRKYSCVRECR